MAAATGNTEIAEALIKHHANINQLSTKEWTII